MRIKEKFNIFSRWSTSYLVPLAERLERYVQKPLIASVVTFQTICILSDLISFNVKPHIDYVIFFSLLLIFNGLTSRNVIYVLSALLSILSFCCLRSDEISSMYLVWPLVIVFLLTCTSLIRNYLGQHVDFVPNKVGVNESEVSCQLLVYLFFIIFYGLNAYLRPEISISEFAVPILPKQLLFSNLISYEKNGDDSAFYMFANIAVLSVCIFSMIGLVKRNRRA